MDIPPAATANFALRIKNLKQNQVRVRRLEALETLGSVQVFCFDKTGTITRNPISVIEVFVGEKTIKISNRQFSSNGRAIDPHTHRDPGELIRAGVLCNEAVFDKGAADGASSLSGSPTGPHYPGEPLFMTFNSQNHGLFQKNNTPSTDKPIEMIIMMRKAWGEF